MSKPIAVLISDIHFGLHTLELAAQALLKAQFKAKMLKVPLVIAGDLLDTKAIIRAEVANKLIEIMSVIDAPETIILVGNHDLINEKGREHALNFLKPYAVIIDVPQVAHLCGTAVQMIPYQSDPQVIVDILSDKEFTPPPMVIMHQGVQGSSMGDYVVDKSALPKDAFADYRVISGHYHPRQTIKCRMLPRCIGGSFSAIREEHALHNKGIGKFDYIGNPYTLGFGEANDPEKGYQILHDDGTLEFVHTNLRKHVVYDVSVRELNNAFLKHQMGDLVWLKVRGTKEELEKASNRIVVEGWKIDLIPLDQETQAPTKADMLSQAELLDEMIDSMTNTSDTTKVRLKELWRTCASN
jgi:DNA repair exonuclease SbcCD nuclease subunit